MLVLQIEVSKYIEQSSLISDLVIFYFIMYNYMYLGLMLKEQHVELKLGV